MLPRLAGSKSSVNSPWHMIISFALILFFALLGDALLSFWVPNFLEISFSSTFLMGMVMGFSSLVGLSADILFPQIICGISVNTLLWLGIGSSLLFILILAQSTFTPFLIIFLLAMAVWGVYYEFFGFAQQQFVADATPLKLHSATWGFLHVFRSIAYFLGPLLGGYILNSGGDRLVLLTASIFVMLSVIILFFTQAKHKRKVAPKLHTVHLWAEIDHWRVLFKTVWPAILVSLFLSMIDATFWTVGAIFTEKLSLMHSLGHWFLPAFVFPSIFVGIFLAKLKVYDHKKKWAELCMLLSSLSMTSFLFTQRPIFLIGIAGIVGALSALAFPLIESVYSDVASRMNKNEQHLIGLSRSSMSLAYILGPVLMGFVSELTSERFTFVLLGIVGIFVSTVLLLYTPRKLKLPQKEIHQWE